MGGPGDGTNPEELFAVGYAACFESAIGGVARRRQLEAGEVSIDSSVSLFPTGDAVYKFAVTPTHRYRRSAIEGPRPNSSERPISSVRTPTPHEAISTSTSGWMANQSDASTPTELRGTK